MISTGVQKTITVAMAIRMLAPQEEILSCLMACAYEQGYWMMVTQETGIVAEHQQQVAGPHHHIEFHERGDGSVTGQRTGDNLVLALAEDALLYPGDEVAACLDAEDIHGHNQHPEAEGGRHDQVLGLGYHLTVHYLRLNSVTGGIVLEQELHPAGPEKQAAHQSEDSLPGVALDEDSGNHDTQSHGSHSESAAVQGRLRKKMFHENHQRMSQGHGAENYQKCHQGPAPVSSINNF